MNTLFGFDPVKSISYSNDEIIRNIMSLCNIKQFDLDCTYSKGVFWRNLPQPLYKTDLLPQSPKVIKACSSDLPFDNESLSSIMFDPPFIMGGIGETYKNNTDKGSSIITKRFGAFGNFNELKEMYFAALKESYRILKTDG
jgi:hypothetical protein